MASRSMTGDGLEIPGGGTASASRLLEELLAKLDAARDPAREEALRRYRRSLPHL